MAHEPNSDKNSNNNDDAAEALDFTGRWIREPSLCIGLPEALEARGYDKDIAAKKALGPYVQEWFKRQTTNDTTASSSSSSSFWNVTTYNTEMDKPWRKVTYPTVGEFQETYHGSSVIFGPSDPQGSILKRHVEYQSCTESDLGVAYVIITQNPHGDATEISKRYLSKGKLVLERTFRRSNSSTRSDDNVYVVSTEVFERETK
mmetsp:Transcript_22305/g.31321  ORF Transcript_22305/g.31321 Transcript_22305/m.31321 type:complete len:203 (+) Transcript_22305:90-698(+)